MTTTPGGLLLVLAVIVPVIGVLAGFAAGGRNAGRIAVATVVAGLVLAIAVAAVFLQSETTVVYILGGWPPPLGVALRADGPAVLMLLLVAVVIAAIAVYARADFAIPEGIDETRSSFVFWTLLLAIWGAMNLVFVGGDLFTLYVALEIMTFAAVPLVSLEGRAETLQAALRYLLFALFGSMLYLLGAVILYGIYGTLDIALLAEQVQPAPATAIAAAVMTVGLLAKTALVPLHLWLPPAHAGAPPAASAVLSGLVIKGSWFLLVRIWFEVFANTVTMPAAQLLGAFGGAAILLGNIVALRQARLKLLIAYSTVAQIGYLFLMFPLGFDTGMPVTGQENAVAGGVLQAASHAGAKAAMFMAAGSIYLALGHDRVGDLAGLGRALPLTVVTFAIAGLALLGAPPGGAFLAKKLLLGTEAGGQWWWALVMELGGLLTAAYVLLVLGHALWPTAGPVALKRRVSRRAEYAALALALFSMGLGLVAWLPDVPAVLPAPFALGELGKTVLVLLGGAALAAILAPRLPGTLDERRGASSLRRAGAAFSQPFVAADTALRQWAVACVALVLTAVALGVALHGAGVQP